MIKKDIPIIEEFIGSTDDINYYCSPCKTFRMYYKMNGSDIDMDTFVIVLTPLQCAGEAVKNVVNNLARIGIFVTAIEHKRGTNQVYTFKKITE